MWSACEGCQLEVQQRDIKQQRGLHVPDSPQP